VGKQFSEGRNDRKRKKDRNKEIAREWGRLGLTKAHLCAVRFGPSSCLHTPMAGDTMGQANILSQDGI